MSIYRLSFLHARSEQPFAFVEFQAADDSAAREVSSRYIGSIPIELRSGRRLVCASCAERSVIWPPTPDAQRDHAQHSCSGFAFG